MGNLRQVPSIETLLGTEAGRELASQYGRTITVQALREAASSMRAELLSRRADTAGETAIIKRAAARLEEVQANRLKLVLNLTGTVLHTNLGRASLADRAVDAVVAVARGSSNLEYDLQTGGRGDRDDHIEKILCQLTGAEAVTVVNNNAAAVLLVLNTLALRKDVLVSRGELIEIGDSFRMPDIMARAGCRLREVGTTNRTHLKDFVEALSPRTALVMKVHASNYRIDGFTSSVPERELAKLAHDAGLPYAVDLGSGSLADLSKLGLPREPMPQDALRAGADLVTFSGDKLLGGPQAGLILGRGDLITRLKRNPLKRALRCDKMTIAALASTVALHTDGARLAASLPALRLLTRPQADIAAAANRLRAGLSSTLSEWAIVEVVECMSQIGSGALPTDRLPSAGLRIAPLTGKKGRPKISLRRLSSALRRLPIPVIGRMHKDALLLDLRCLEHEAAFAAQLPQLSELLRGQGDGA